MNRVIRDLVLRGDLDGVVLACNEDEAWWSQIDEEGKTYLHLAIENKCTGIALWLINHGALVNQADNDGYTPLMLAALKGSYTTASELVSHQANLEVLDSSGQTALHKAVFSRSEPIIGLLLTAGAETNVEAKDGIRPLDLLFEDLKIARMLREYRALLGRGPGLRVQAA